MANIYDTQTYLTMRRSKMDQKYSYKTSMPFGKLVPIGGTPLDILPGDTAKLDLYNMTRMLTPVAPIMDGISMDVYAFFVPWRVLFSKTKQFFGENDSVAWTLVQNVNLPHIILDGLDELDGVYTSVEADFKSGNYLYLVKLDSDSAPEEVLESVFAGSLFDYMGLPFVYPNMDLLGQINQLKLDDESDLISLQAMPFRAIQSIYNEFFRNENVTDPILDLVYDHQDVSFGLKYICAMYKGTSSIGGFSRDFWFLPSVARWKDLFTSCLPAPQRGASVALPLAGSNAPLVTGVWHKTGDGAIQIGSDTTISGFTGTSYGLNSYVVGTLDAPGLQGSHGNLSLREASGDFSSKTVNYTNLEADLSQVTMATVNQIRYAFATQRYYEKLARSGSRYHEYLKVMFGVRPSDAVLQRPQFLGGHHQLINVQQVLQTSETSATPLGSTGAYSLTGFRSHTFTNSFEEFGIVMNFACIRKEHTYCQGLDRYWTKRDIWDIYNPTFAHIGEVPVAKNEVYWQPGNTANLGYNEAWYEYRSTSSKVCGLLNPLAPNNLSSFVLTDVFETAPTLSDNFIFEDAQGLDRALVAGASATDQFICDFAFNYTLSRVMPVRSYPGLIDHF